ncbi:MAG: hypothetical protein AAF608_14500 [Pseudomonadota bacterium]
MDFNELHYSIMISSFIIGVFLCLGLAISSRNNNPKQTKTLIDAPNQSYFRKSGLIQEQSVLFDARIAAVVRLFNLIANTVARAVAAEIAFQVAKDIIINALADLENLTDYDFSEMKAKVKNAINPLDLILIPTGLKEILFP